jgi:UDP-2-acetamido-2,6-beta-L-arabino-hexul-4-ose reductase
MAVEVGESASMGRNQWHRVVGVNRVLVTGSAGFIGRRVADLLKSDGHELLTYEVNDPPSTLGEHVTNADFIFHLAGVNRPSDPDEFEKVNARLTEEICALASRASAQPVVVLSSSTQSLLDNPYGVSKRRAERAVERFAENHGRAVIFRLPNVFGPGGRPNYNSVVATFAHNVSQGLPLEIHDPNRELTLVYVHDVAKAMLDVTRALPPTGEAEFREVSPIAHITVGELADALTGYHLSRSNVTVPEVTDGFRRKLYATYLSYLRPDSFGYDLARRSDDRGTLAEFLKSVSGGQLFISRTRPGAIRGNHYHHTKTEKFFVVEGDALIRFRRVDEIGDVIEYRVNGTDLRVIDIPPDYTHSIENVGCNELVVLFWASEIFDADAPDTLQLKV